MRELRVVFIGALLVSVALVGCLGGDDPAPVRQFSASSGIASDGYAYDGQGLQQAGAELTGSVSAPENTGSLSATFEFAGSTWQVSQSSFSGEEPFKEGGVAFNLVEHGDTGVSTPIIPRIDGEVVTYGTGEVLRDGQAVGGPWAVHLMLSRDTIRGADGLIAQSDGSTPYDPNQPGNARIVEDDRQALLQLTASGGPDSARAPENVSESVTFQGPESNQTVTVPADRFAVVGLNITASGGSSPVGVGELQVAVVDGQGNEVATDEGTVTPAEGYNGSFQVVPAGGNVTVELTGQGSFTVDVVAHVIYDDHPFIILTWDDYTIQELDELP